MNFSPRSAVPGVALAAALAIWFFHDRKPAVRDTGIPPVAMQPWNAQSWEAISKTLFFGPSYHLCLEYRDPAAREDACAALRDCEKRGTSALEKELAEEKNPAGQARILEALGDLNAYKDTSLARAPMYYERALGTGARQSEFSWENLYLKKAAAELRLGELQNCVAHHNAKSCVFPLDTQAYHAAKEGSGNAVVTLEKLWKIHPGHPQARWLLNLAYMTLGKYPAGVPADILIPPALFHDEVSFPYFGDIAQKLGVAKLSEEGGALLEDVNNDGYLDVLLSARGACNGMSYFENDRHGHFIDKSDASGLIQQRDVTNFAAGDFDNDGNIDLYLMRGSWLTSDDPFPKRATLLKNRGNGRFENVTKLAGLETDPVASNAAVWFDADNDGWLDLFVCNENRAPYFYKNQRDGTFKNVIQQTGISNSEVCKTVAVGDINDDGLLDLYLGNYLGSKKLFMNKGGLRFEEAPSPVIGASPLRPVTSWFFDVNNDGLMDLFVAAFNPNLWLYAQSLAGTDDHSNGAKLFVNEGDGKFVDRSGELGLSRFDMSMSAGFGDLNNDGFPDVFLGGGSYELRGPGISRVYLNQSGKKFSEVTFSGGFGSLQKTHGVSFGDINNDGYPEILVSHGGAYPSDRNITTVHKNPGFSSFHNHWITLRLRGTKSNRSAIGARIEVTVMEGGKSRKIFHSVLPGTGYEANPLQANIGLGSAKKIDSVKIFWPSHDSVQELHDIPLDAFYSVEEGAPKAIPIPLKSFPLP